MCVVSKIEALVNCSKGKHMPNMKRKVKWGLAKDDVSPQDL